jgi:hypothetical protein
VIAMHGRSTLSLLTRLTVALAVSGCGASQMAVDAAPEPRPELVSASERTVDEPRDAKRAFAGDRGSALLAELLAPARSDIRLETSASPRPPLARDWQEPALPQVSSDSAMPRLPLEKSLTKPRPAELADPVPLLDQLISPHLPESPYLPVGPRLRVPSPDVNEPIPLPILARQAQDRTALDDPTIKASLAAALALSPPLRATAMPFVRFLLPNPFEHREAVRLREPPPEDSIPVNATPRVPGKP